MPEYERMPRDLQILLSGAAFRARRRLGLPFLTVDPEGFPRAALLTFGQVRANSRKELAIAVRAGSRTAANLIRRHKAALLYFARNRAVWVQAEAGRGRTSDCDPDRQIFPLTVYRVKVDRPGSVEGMVSLLPGPSFSAADLPRFFSEELFDELGLVKPDPTG